MPEIDVTELPKLDRSLLPEYQSYRANQPDPRVQGLWDFLFDKANHELAAAFSKLFWPDLLEIDGLIVLAEHFPKLGYTPAEYQERLRTNPGGIEFTVNYLSVGYMYKGFGVTVDDDGEVHEVFGQDLMDYLARIILISWKHALKEAYPDKEFTFVYLVDPDGANRRISFFQSHWAERPAD